jgi:type VI secretion system protein ImpH
MGLTGPMGVLPRHYTARIIDRVRSHGERRPDPTLRDFLDLFHHRLVSLLHRAWKKPRFAVQVERRMLRPADATNPQPDDLTRYLYSLIGMGTPGLLGRQEFPDDGLLFYAGVLGHLPRSVQTLTEVLVEWLDLPVRVQQFVGASYPIPPELWTQLGETSCGLGESAILGDEAFVPDAKFRVTIGPLSPEQYESLLPASPGGSEGRSFRQLVQLVRLIAGPDLDFDIQLLLAPGDISGCVLGAEGSFAPQLGHTAWLLDEERVSGLSDTIFAGTLTGLATEKGV